MKHLKFWWQFFKDKRFDWDFKIANFIMRDSLRDYIAVDCMVLQEVLESDKCTMFHKQKIYNVIRDLQRLMKCKQNEETK